jgi:hypothetical protein
LLREKYGSVRVARDGLMEEMNFAAIAFVGSVRVTNCYFEPVPACRKFHHIGNDTRKRPQTGVHSRMVGNPSTTAHPAQGFGSMPMRSLTADRIRCLHPR